ncbi:MAG: zinc transporter ZupT [Candidatus Micrarchaeota archaeon]
MLLSDAAFPLLLALAAGLCTALGAALVLLFGRFTHRGLAFALGLSAGAMIYVSFVELLGSAIASAGFIAANVAFFGGMLVIALIDFFVPHAYICERVGVNASPCESHASANLGWAGGALNGRGERRGRGRGGPGFGRGLRQQKLMLAGVFTAIGIAIHNFPEGLTVFLGATSSAGLGLALAFAIAIHNIPEGIAIAMPVYCASKSKRKAFLYSLAAGLAEPFGAFLGFLFLMPYLTPAFLALALAFVAGIMIFISFDELLPLCFENCEGGHASIMGVIIGMLVMALSLHLL